MTALQLVIFDMDGLIFNTEEIAYETMAKSMQEFGKDFPIDLYKSMIGMRAGETNKLLLDAYGADFPIEALYTHFRENFYQVVGEGGLGVKPGVTELLDYLDGAGIKKCIASSSSLQTIERYLAIENLADRFDFYVSGEEVAHGKPAPDVFLEACKRAGVETGDAIVLEDSLNGLRAAYRADIDCIVIPDMIAANAEMQEKALKIMPTLHEVIGFLEK